MTQDQQKLSTGWKAWIIFALLIYLSAMSYTIYMDFIVADKKDFTGISTMIVILIVGITSMLPTLKRW
ncbi:MAG: hypothetical protein HY063_10605 [Bacteroidetes bacterium]|nr:hypothetical protein [Bacteroidota bacterium]